MRETTTPVGDDVAAGMKRRTILAGAAWSVPAIAVATASPAFAATTTTKKADIQITSVQWNAQGGTSAVPADATFNADNGLFVDATVRNNGPDTITGVSVAISLPISAHQLDPSKSHYPEASDGWSYYTSYDDVTVPGNRVVTFRNDSLTLAPSQTATVRIKYWTTSDKGVTVDNIKPFVAFQATDPNVEETNQSNNGEKTANSYNVHT
ncbi:hypothetical protein ACFWZW_02170 [Microbacterium enclense]|uniref:hypothetical protein n=1 Tax=Microbacterium enclense TaxID=993073 RepID=UPI0036DA8581